MPRITPTVTPSLRITSQGGVKQAMDVCRLRMRCVALVVVFCFAVITVRLFEVAIAGGEGGRDLTIPQLADLHVERGAIVDRNGVLLAANLATKSLYANPHHIIDPNEAAQKLVRLFPTLSKKKLLQKLSSKRRFVWIKRNLPPREQQAVMQLGIPGLEFRAEEKRIYPHGSVAAHVVGMVGLDGHGLSGVEKQFDTSFFTAKGQDTPLQLSVDIRAQAALHQELSRGIKEFRAKGGAGIVLDVNTSEVLAMASLPDFDPNNPHKIKSGATFNRATYGVYEMGSTFKAFTMALALDKGIAGLGDAYDATKPLRFARHTIRDHHPENRWLSLPEVFMHSSNIGTARIAMDIGQERQKTFMEQLGMLQPVGIELPETAMPMGPQRWRMINAMTISYGHGIAVTPLHLVAATASLVNGGMYHTPTILKRSAAEQPEGTRVIKKRTSDLMRKLYRLVVTDGTGKKAAVNGYMVGGKTGTAEKIVDGKYDHKARISSYIAAFPMTKPKYVVLIVLDEPRGNASTFNIATGGMTAAPITSRVIHRIAPMMGVIPVDEQDEAIKKRFAIDYALRRNTLASLNTHP